MTWITSGESWTTKKAERWRIDASELCCWRRLLRVPWTARRSNQSILKEIRPEYPLEGRMLKLQYFGRVMQRTDSVKKTLMLRKIEGRRKRGKQRLMWVWGNSGWRAAVHDVSKSWTGLSDRRTTTKQKETFWGVLGWISQITFKICSNLDN